MRGFTGRKVEVKKLAPAIPGLFTFGNLICGLFAILHSMGSRPLYAAWFIFLGAFLDMLDGKVARMTRGSTRIGVQLDSLADFTTFGIAPLALLHALGLFDMHDWRLAVAILYVFAGAYRLARFNVSAKDEGMRVFCGLPIPAAAVTIASALLFIDKVWPPVEGRGILGGIALLAWLMISQVKYPKTLPRINFGKKRNLILIIPILLLILALILFPIYLIYPLMMLYILFGVVSELKYAFTGKKGDGDENLSCTSNS